MRLRIRELLLVSTLVGAVGGCLRPFGDWQVGESNDCLLHEQELRVDFPIPELQKPPARRDDIDPSSLSAAVVPDGTFASVHAQAEGCWNGGPTLWREARLVGIIPEGASATLLARADAAEWVTIGTVYGDEYGGTAGATLDLDQEGSFLDLRLDVRPARTGPAPDIYEAVLVRACDDSYDDTFYEEGVDGESWYDEGC